MDTLYELELETFKIKLAVAEPTLTPARCAEDAVRILRPLYANLDADQEHFSILMLNNKNRVRAFKVISTGSQTSSLVHPREVFRAAVLYGACGIIACHNHPSGDPAPSPEDIDITKRLRECSDLLGVRFTDSVILGKDSYYSFDDERMVRASGVTSPEPKREDLDDVRSFLWQRKIKRKTIAAALNCDYQYLCSTLRGYREIDAELDAIAGYLKITREHLGLLIDGKAPRTEPL